MPVLTIVVMVGDLAAAVIECNTGAAGAKWTVIGFALTIEQGDPAVVTAGPVAEILNKRASSATAGSRAVADMSLARADGVKDRFYSMSTQIEAERSRYFEELESAQRNDVDITQWLSWFLDCLGRAIDGAERLLASVLTKASIWKRINQHSLNDRQRLVVERLLDDFQGALTTSKCAKLAKCSSDTALRDIRELLQHGILLQNSQRGRGTSYRLVSAEESLDRG